MKVREQDLTRIEETKKVVIVDSVFPEIAYAIDKKHGAMYIINRQTGHELQLAAENVKAFASEMNAVAEVHLPQKSH